MAKLPEDYGKGALDKKWGDESIPAPVKREDYEKSEAKGGLGKSTDAVQQVEENAAPLFYSEDEIKEKANKVFDEVADSVKSSVEFIDEKISSGAESVVNKAKEKHAKRRELRRTEKEKRKTTREQKKSENVKKEVPRKNASNLKLIRIVWVVVIAVFMVALGVFVFFYFSGKDSDGDSNSAVVETEASSRMEEETVNPTTKPTPKSTATPTINPTVEPTPAPSSSLNEKDYVGYWHLPNAGELELAINSITDNQVDFTYWSYPNDPIANIVADLERSVAQFSHDSGEIKIEGFLTFNQNSIALDITKSNSDNIQPVSYTFRERNQQSRVQIYQGYAPEEPGTPAFSPYTIRILAGTADIYDGPGYECNLVSSITDKGVYTIVEECELYGQGIWGRLKSGTGWINLNDALSEDVGYYEYYILPDSADRLLTYEDIQYLSKNELELARNEIYARHGRIFENTELRIYFESQSWYSGTTHAADFSEDMLSQTEKSNVAFIMSYE